MDTIPNTAAVEIIHYAPRFSAICSVGLAPFHGTIEIEYHPADRLLEFASFETWLRSVANNHLTIENLTRLTFEQLTAALGDIPLRVTVFAETTVHAPVSATIERKPK